MRKTNKLLEDKDCREILMEIVEMVLENYCSPLRKGFTSRMGQCGFDLISILRQRGILMPGEQNQQEKLEL